MTNLGEKIKRASCSFLSEIPDGIKSYPDGSYKTRVESTDDENPTQLAVYEMHANSAGTLIEFVIRKSL
jgi:hypothetical protein